MKYIIQILVFVIFNAFNIQAQDVKAIKLYEDEYLTVQVQCLKEANILNRDWLSIIFSNKSDDIISIDNFEYSTEYDTKSFDLGENRKNSLGQGNKYDVFPVFEAKINPSNQEIKIKPKENVIGYRSVSNYASVLLGYDKPSDQLIFAKIEAKCKYSVAGLKLEFEKKSSEFSFTWTKADPELLPNRLVEACDSIHLRGNFWIIESLANDIGVTSHIPVSTYVKLITQRISDSFSTRRKIIGAFVKQYGSNDELNEFYTEQLQTANSIILQDLESYWDDCLFVPLVASFQLNNTNHYKFLTLIDNHYDLWRDNLQLKSELFEQVKEYASEVLVTTRQLTTNNKGAWHSWLKKLSVTHSEEAESYFKSFFKNKLKLFEENSRYFKFHNNAPPYYPVSRACDAALEAFIYSKYEDIGKVYRRKFDYLVERGVLKRSESNSRFHIGNRDLQNKENMITIRNELIKDYR